MVRLRYSTTTLLLMLAAAALPCAIISDAVARARAEAAAGLAVERAADRDSRQAYAPQQVRWPSMAVSRSPPRTKWQRFVHYLVGSEGPIWSVDIVGDTSALTYECVAKQLPHLRWLSVTPTRRGYNPGVITDIQLRAAAACPRNWERVEISGKFLPDGDFTPLRRLGSIEQLHIDAKVWCPQLIQELGTIQADSIRLRCDESDQQLIPAAAFHSFRFSPCTSLDIAACLDDRAMALIAAAPNLESLELTCSPLPYAGGPISDEGIRLASPLLNTWYLKLGYCAITDDCMEAISRIKHLKRIEFVACEQITDRGIGHLRKLRPDVAVSADK